MVTQRLDLRRLGLFLAALCLCACASAPPPASEPPVPAELPRRVAVLPFVNRTPNPDAAVILRRMFCNFFSSLNYVDIEPWLVDASLAANGWDAEVRAGQLPPIERLGRLLDVDAVVVGEALELGQTYALVYANQQAGLRARLIDCRTGRVVWGAERTVTLHTGDLPLSLTGLAASLVKTAISYQQADIFGAASELCRQLVATVPDPPVAPDAAPAIRALVHNGAGRLLLPGDEFRAVLVGEPGQRAALSVPNVLEAPMEEKDPGVYVASYRIRPGDRTTGEGQVVGMLRSPGGAGRQWVDTLGGVRVGTPTMLPHSIAADTVLTRDRSPYLVDPVLVIHPGATLTIEPGVVIWFEGRGLIVRGRIEALGTADQPIVFSGLSARGWKGVFVDSSPVENRLRHCRVSGAEYGIRAARSVLTLEHCTLQDNAWALVVEEGVLGLTRCLVRTSGRTGIAVRRAAASVTGSIVTENGGGGILAENAVVRVDASHLQNNGGWPIRAVGDAAEVDASGNWWGSPHAPPAESALKPVRVEPVLSAPIPFVGPET